MTSQTFKQAAYAQETGEVFIALLTVTSEELSEPIYVTSDPKQMLPIANVPGVISNGIEFIFMPFDIWLPRDDKTGSVSAKIEIENTDRRIIGQLRSIRKAANIHMQCVLSNNTDNIELNYDYFQLSNVQYDVARISGDLTLNYWSLEPFPSIRFTPAGFPGLF